MLILIVFNSIVLVNNFVKKLVKDISHLKPLMISFCRPFNFKQDP
jgi:hypothetical protein